MSTPPVCAIVINWNGWRDTIPCLESLLAQDAPLAILVCDNGSSNDSLERLREWQATRPEAPVQLLPLERNLGYAGALNAGVRWSQEHWGSRRFWLLNNDIEAEPGALRALQEVHAAVPDAGVVGSVLLDWDDNRVQAVGGMFRRWLGIGWHLQQIPPGDEAACLAIDYPVGASMYVEQAYLDAVGLMDDSYFLYCEEMDWVERGRRHGYRPVVALRSRLRHKEGASTGSRGGVRRKSLLSERYGVINRLRITRKFWPYFLPVVWFSLWLVAADRVAHREFARAGLVLKLLFAPGLWLR